MLLRPPVANDPITFPNRPAGFIRPGLPAWRIGRLSGSMGLREIKFSGNRVIGRKDGERVRLWGRTRFDYSHGFMRIRESIAALPVDSAYDLMEVDGHDVPPESLGSADKASQAALPEEQNHR